MPSSTFGTSSEHASQHWPKVAILGIHLEANSFAPLTEKQDFVDECWAEAEEITELAGKVSNLPLEVPAFYRYMDETASWIPAPIMVAGAQPNGPIRQEVFDEFLAKVETGLKAAMPIDAAYICSHGGSLATGDGDNDGTLVARVREIIGPDAAIVVTHDLHCNVSDRLIRSCDALITYRTCPHVDQPEVAREAADLLRMRLAGKKLSKAFVRLPMAPPGIMTSTLTGAYADIVNFGKSFTEHPVLSVSVSAGFVHADLPKCGITVNVVTDDDQVTADRVALEIAQYAWDKRNDFSRQDTTLPEAVSLAKEAGTGKTPPVLLADIADNPGGGARANTIWLLKALHEAAVPGVAIGLFTDPVLAADAHEAGEGAPFNAIFNRKEQPFAERFEVGATVVKVNDGFAIGRRGRDAGREIRLGKSALLRLDESNVEVIVTSLREQPADPRCFEMFGIDIGALKCAVLKSTVHFRSGFDEFFTPEQIFEVALPGVLSFNLSDFEFKGLPRPIWPLDDNVTWVPSTPLH